MRMVFHRFVAQFSDVKKFNLRRLKMSPKLELALFAWVNICNSYKKNYV